jgi:hypothetical protein
MAKKSNPSKKPEPELPDEDYSSEDDSSEDDDDLILEGVLRRNPEVESSSDEEESDNSEEEDKKQPAKKKSKVEPSNKQKKAVKKKKGKNDDGIEIIPVEFTFNDMDEKYFHGMKNHLITQPAYAPYSSDLSDLMIENVAVGTVVSTEDGADNVFGFGSVLNVSTHGDKECIQHVKKLCMASCPKQHQKELEVVFSGKTKRPAGLFLHGRMVNLPLEITLVLHEQLVLDMDWAVKNAEGGEEERKSLDFGAFILLAPCSRDDTTHNIIYKNFDDEIFAGCAEFSFTITSSDLKKKGVAKESGDSDQEMVSVVVLTKTGHREAMNEIAKLVHG